MKAKVIIQVEAATIKWEFRPFRLHLDICVYLCNENETWKSALSKGLHKLADNIGEGKRKSLSNKKLFKRIEIK